MRARSTPALVMPALALAAGLLLVGCSREDVAAGGAGGAGGGAGDFCAAYEEAGGTLATPGLFQVAMTREQTVADLTPRIEVLEAVTPPDDIAADWQTLQDLYAEAVTIAEATPEGGVVSDPRVFEIVDELDKPSSSVSEYLGATC